MNPIYEDDESEPTDIRLAKALARIDELSKLLADPLKAMASLVQLTNDFALKMQEAEGLRARAEAATALLTRSWDHLVETQTLWVVTRHLPGSDAVPSLVIVGDIGVMQAKGILHTHSKEVGRQLVEFKRAKWDVVPVKAHVKLVTAEQLLDGLSDKEDSDEFSARDSDDEEPPRRVKRKSPLESRLEARGEKPSKPLPRANDTDEDDDD